MDEMREAFGKILLMMPQNTKAETVAVVDALVQAALAHRDAQPLEFNEAEGWVRIADGPMAGTYYKQ